MNNRITPPPDQDLPAAVRSRQRDELAAIVDHEAETPRRRTVVPLLAAAAVLAVAAGLAIAVPALRDNDKPAPAGVLPTASLPKVATSNTPKNQPAKTRELSAAEKAAFRTKCINFTAASSEPFADFKVIQAFEYVDTARPSLAKGWLVTRKGMDYWICSRDGYGSVATYFVFGPGLSERNKDVPYLFAPVDERGGNAGMYIPSVSRVTVQHDREPAVEAVLRDGFWFAPMEDAKLTKDSKGRPVLPDNHLIGVTAGWTIRGYDGAGKLIYDSSQNGPQVKKCYSNPAATEVVVVNAVKNPTPATCQKMFDWR